MNGIKRQLTTNTPQQNGIVKMKKRTMMEMERTMLQTRELSNSFWGGEVATTIYMFSIKVPQLQLKLGLITNHGMTKILMLIISKFLDFYPMFM